MRPFFRDVKDVFRLLETLEWCRHWLQREAFLDIVDWPMDTIRFMFRQAVGDFFVAELFYQTYIGCAELESPYVDSENVVGVYQMHWISQKLTKRF